MQVSEIQLFQLLKEKIGEKKAQTLVEYVETKNEKEFDGKRDVLVTKEDLAWEVGNTNLISSNGCLFFGLGN